jgi:hypothetical protein
MADAVKPVKWALETAVLGARIPPSGKLIMLVLLAKASPDSLDLGRYSPGTRKLAEQTGLKTDTVTKYLGLLEQHSWLTARKRPGKRAEYALSEGRAFQASEPRRRPGTVPVNGYTGGQCVPIDGDGGVPTDGDGGVPVNGDGGVPTDGTTYISLTKDTPGMTRASQTVSLRGEDKPGIDFDSLFADGGNLPGEAGIT